MNTFILKSTFEKTQNEFPHAVPNRLLAKATLLHYSEVIQYCYRVS